MKKIPVKKIWYTLSLGAGLCIYCLLLAFAESRTKSDSSGVYASTWPHNSIQTMNTILIEGIRLDYCHTCEGLWFDHDELAQVLQSLDMPYAIFTMDNILALPRAVAFEPERRCLLCNKTMIKTTLPSNTHVVVDVCPDGEGMWLEKDDYENLIESLLPYKLVHPDRLMASNSIAD